MYKFVQKNVKTGERKVAVKQISNEFNPQQSRILEKYKMIQYNKIIDRKNQYEDFYE